MESEVEILCRQKEQELLDKYFPQGPGHAESETIGEYTKDLLVMRLDFLEEITSRRINCKAY